MATTTSPALFDLLGLNDDCIIAILRHISLEDLAATAVTCSRLETVARRVFVLDEANKSYHINYWTNVEAVLADNCEIRTNDHSRLPIGQIGHGEFLRIRDPQPYHAEKRVHQVLEAFGDLLEEINLEYMFPLIINHPDEWSDYRFPNQLLFEHIIQHCSGTLQKLRIREFVWTPELAAKAAPLLNHLTKFDSNACWNTELILPALIACEELSINGDLSAEAFRNRFPKLKKFTLFEHELCAEGNDLDAAMRRYEQYFNEFLLDHRNLTHLKFDTPMYFDITAVGQMHDLEQLEIEGHEMRLKLDDPTAFQFGRLTKLILSPCCQQLSALLVRISESASADTLTYLKISDAAMNDTVFDALNRFEKLETLKLRHFRTSKPDSVGTFHKLQCLKKLTVHFSESRRFRLPLLPSLERMKLVNVTFDVNLIQAIGRLPQLVYLKLAEADIDMRMCDDEKRQLEMVQHLQKLRLTNSSIAKEWLRYSGSAISLTSLEIDDIGIDSELIDGLCRHQSLRELDIRNSTIEDISKASKESLSHLKEVRKLFLIRNRDSIDEILENLGAIDALQTLRIVEVAIDDMTIDSICRYQNLRDLQIESAPDLSNRHLRALLGFENMWKLTLSSRNWYGASEFDWRGLLNFVALHRTIHFLELKSFEITDFDRNIFDDLMAMCRTQLRKIIVEFHDYRTLDLPDYMFELDNCQFVEVRQKLLV